MLQHLCNTSMQMDAFSYVFVQLIHTYTYMYFFFLRTIREKGMWNGPRYKFFTSDFRVQIVLSRVTFFADGNERVENRLDKEKEECTRIFQFHWLLAPYRSYTWTRVYSFFPRIIRYRREFYVPRDTERKPTSREQIIINWRIGFVVG